MIYENGDAFITNSKSKKIAFLLESLNLGGIGRLSILLAEEFSKRGYRVDLVVGRKQGQFLKQVPSNVNLVDLKVKRLLSSIHLIGSYLKKDMPDVLISANERVNIVALLAKKIFRSKTKVIISVHVNNSEALASQRVTLYKKVIIIAARLIYKRADHIVTVSKGVAADVEKIFSIPPEKISVIYNPIINANLYNKMNEPVKHPWLKQKDYPVIIGMGRLSKQKDFLTLIRSIVDLKKEIGNVKLLIMGEGKEKSRLEKEIKVLGLENDVDLPGFTDNPYSYLKNSSVFVLSSAWEGFGNVLVEAMSTGTPVVSTDCLSGPAEILEDGKYGPLVPVGDSKALAAAVLDILKNPPDPERLIRRAHFFSVDRAAENYLKIIEGD